MGLLAGLILFGALFQASAGTGSTAAGETQNSTLPQGPPPAQASDPAKPITVTAGASMIQSAKRTVQIPFIARPPKMEEFESMEASRSDMVKVSGFIQQNPTDGAEPTQRTEVYMGYDHQNLYVVWLCFDKEPQKIRAHLGRRENIFDDDYVEITLDTFHDQRRGLVFSTNPVGIQADGLWSENSGNDTSWDTVWNTWGKVTAHGYVVIQAIPFHNMRFPTRQASPIWGFTLDRWIPRNDEGDWWPRVSSKISGLLNQEANLSGLEGISPGKNMQFNPYAFARSFHSINQDVPTNPVFQSKTFDGKAGLDSKVIFQDKWVLDTTVEPDFSQIESDQPQNTVNQRFEVFFPEKRPFFLENSNFFESLNFYQQNRLLFTRRIADPEFGARLTGKDGPWAVGLLVSDDRSPGEQVLPNDPLFAKRAYFAVGRVAYDVGKNSNIGVIYTDREFAGDFNRVGGLDFSFKLNKNWNLTYRGVISTTLDNANGNGYSFGSNHDGSIFGNGERFTFIGQYQDITGGFRELLGFIRRTDIRRLNGYYHFYWKPQKNKMKMILYGPELNVDRTYDHTGLGVEYNVNVDWAFGFHRNTIFAPVVGIESDTLRPQDFTGLTFDKKFTQDFGGIVFRTSPLRQLIFNINTFRQGAVNIVVPAGQLPNEGDETTINAGLTYKPFNGLQIDNTYIMDRVRHNPLGHAVFDNHIIRSKWNYQFTPALSLRVIAQYNGLLANQQFSSLQTTKNMNFDFLFTYLPHPGTAIYAGYNSNLENIDPELCVKVAGQCDPNGIGLVHGPGRLLNDGRQVFIKISYLWHP
ncbi:MAG TPA: DUF5916 domain-containing protein [Candidatus Angelobacter sp.]|nr:DUF5916 domain-containing protein [Candidatus Angelobacter sp.]